MVKEKMGKKSAWIATFLLFLFPTAFYLGAYYTESLFIFLILLAFYAVQKKLWLLAGIATLLTTATRVVGVFIIPALWIEVWLQENETYLKNSFPLKEKAIHLLKIFPTFLRTNFLKLLIILVGLGGVLTYMSFLVHEFHDPLYFVHIQSSFETGRQDNLVIYPQVAWRATKILLTSRPFDLHYYAYAQEFVVGIFGLIGLLWSLKYIRFSYVFFALCAFLLPTATGTFSSLPRYVIVCFPLFLFITKFLQKNRLGMILWLSFSTVLLIINTVLFIQGSWVA